MTQTETDARTESREVVAAHELAHAFVLREMGFPIGDIRVNNYWFNAGAYGSCQIKLEDWPRDEQGLIPDKVIRGNLIGTIAGHEGAAHYGLLTGVDVGFTGESDYAYFREAVAQYPVIGEEEAKATARDLVLTFWPQIAELIPQLVDHRRLAGRVVK